MQSCIAGQIRQPVLVTAATIPYLSLEDARRQCRVDSNDEDGLIAEYIAAAGRMVETDAEIALLTSTWAVYLDYFPTWEIELRCGPVTSITSIQYVDSDGTTQTLSSSLYSLDSKHKPARVTPAYSQTWPVTRWQENAATVTWVAGATSQEAVHPMGKQAIRTLVGHWYSNREAVGTVGQEISYTYEACIDRLRWAGGV